MSCGYNICIVVMVHTLCPYNVQNGQATCSLATAQPPHGRFQIWGDGCTKRCQGQGQVRGGSGGSAGLLRDVLYSNRNISNDLQPPPLKRCGSLVLARKRARALAATLVSRFSKTGRTSRVPVGQTFEGELVGRTDKTQREPADPERDACLNHLCTRAVRA